MHRHCPRCGIAIRPAATFCPRCFVAEVREAYDRLLQREISGENVTGQPVSEGDEGSSNLSSSAPRPTPSQGR